MNTIAALAALIFTATPPGTLIDVQASCSYNMAGTAQTSQTGTAYLGILSPAQNTSLKPVFLQRYYRTYQTPNRTTRVRPEALANGMLVRFLKKSPNGSYTVLEGVQLNDGRVLVNGEPVPRDE